MAYLNKKKKIIIDVNFKILSVIEDRSQKKETWFLPKNINQLYYYYFFFIIVVIILGLAAEFFLPTKISTQIITFVNDLFSFLN